MIYAVNDAIQLVGISDGVDFNAARIHTGCAARHEDGSSRFVLLKPGIYSVDFNANIAVPTGQTPGPIQLTLNVDGEIYTGTDAITTPVAVDIYSNVSLHALVRVFGCGGNVSVSIVNTSATPINVQDANIVVEKVA